MDEVVQKATTDTYDISFAAYDRAFAEEMGLDEKYITDMDEGLRWLEIRMLTEGDQTNCYYNMILDKNVELDFPKKDNLPTLSPYPIFTQKAYKSLNDDQKKIKSSFFHVDVNTLTQEDVGAYRNRMRLGNVNFKYHKSGKPFRKETGVMGGLALHYYIYDRIQPYQLLSARNYCGTSVFEADDSAGEAVILITKPNGYRESKFTTPEENHTFKIPQPIVDQFLPIAKHYNSMDKGLKRKQYPKEGNE